MNNENPPEILIEHDGHGTYCHGDGCTDRVRYRFSVSGRIYIVLIPTCNWVWRRSGWAPLGAAAMEVEDATGHELIQGKWLRHWLFTNYGRNDGIDDFIPVGESGPSKYYDATEISKTLGPKPVCKFCREVGPLCGWDLPIKPFPSIGMNAGDHVCRDCYKVRTDGYRICAVCDGLFKPYSDGRHYFYQFCSPTCEEEYGVRCRRESAINRRRLRAEIELQTILQGDLNAK